ncbi:MAG TPA: exosortase-associated EpsI family protein [Candidatus Dormibacteraeota bacterium]|nr:exosortase-associated EpsI family protein [Candidatus Dormibacteraeota bacterium]
MNKRKYILLTVTMLLIGSVAGLLTQLQAHQRLGQAGVKTRPLPESRNVEVVLPERVLDYSSEPIELAAIVTNTLPSDTSYGQRLYKGSDGFEIALNAVLMGTDRTSLHKPQFCLAGQGWNIDQTGSTDSQIHMERPCSYDLPVARLLSTKQFSVNGQNIVKRGVYVYYYIADGQISAGTLGFERMWLMARELMKTGVLQRWAYISYFSICDPGQEEATFERMKQFIAASAPEFQLTPQAPATALSSR